MAIDLLVPSGTPNPLCAQKAGATQRGLKLNGLVIGIDTSGNTTKMYRCTAVTAFDSTNPYADRAATLSAGTKISS